MLGLGLWEVYKTVIALTFQVSGVVHKYVCSVEVEKTDGQTLGKFRLFFHGPLYEEINLHMTGFKVLVNRSDNLAIF